MSKLYWIVVILICGSALWITEKAFSQITTITLPDGKVLTCTTLPSGNVVCG
jgi:hypothetical protein